MGGCAAEDALCVVLIHVFHTAGFTTKGGRGRFAKMAGDEVSGKTRWTSDGK